MVTTSPIMMSYVLEQVMLTNYLREELVQTLRIYSKYYNRVLKRLDVKNDIKKRSEFSKFLKYYSLCDSALNDWLEEIKDSNDLINSFFLENFFLPLTKDFFGLQDDFPVLSKRFDEITYACSKILAVEKEYIEFEVLPYEEASEIFVNGAPVKPPQTPQTSLWNDTAFLITKIENLQETLFQIMQDLKDLEDELSLTISYDCEGFSARYESLEVESRTVLSEIESNHIEVDKMMALFYYSGKYETDKTRAKFEQRFEALYPPSYLQISLNALLITCKFLINCFEASDS